MNKNKSAETIDILTLISDQAGTHSLLKELTILKKNTYDHFIGRDFYYLIVMIVERMDALNLQITTLTEHLTVEKITTSGLPVEELTINIPTLTPTLSLIFGASDAQLRDWLTILAHLTITNSKTLCRTTEWHQSRELKLIVNKYTSVVEVSASNEYCQKHRNIGNQPLHYLGL
ncbi:hypothetical protein AB6D11_00250 [Vibrio splendidus]